MRVSCLRNHEGIRLTNGDVALIATTDVGPRIVEYALAGGRNVLGEALDASIETDYGTWRPYGGHRLWVAPEINPRSYVPDNDPVEVEQLGPLGVRLTAPVEQPTSIQKSMTIVIDDEGSGVDILHRITNLSTWTIELAPWALTIVGSNGEAIVPHEPYRPHAESLLPVRTIALWSYTNLADERLRLGRRSIRVRSDAASTEPLKIGVANARRWAAWHRDGTMFVKRFSYAHDALYPDMGCNTEIYTAGDFMELESLGPMIRLEPDASVEHVERWELYADVAPGDADEDFEIK